MFDAKLQEIANELCSGCREGRERQNLDKLYAENAVSIEAAAMPGMESVETHGVKAIHGKHEWWENANEVHSQKIEGPFFHGDNKFSAIFELDVTDKQSNQRMQMREIALYTVENGKISRVEFFYPNPE